MEEMASTLSYEFRPQDYKPTNSYDPPRKEASKCKGKIKTGQDGGEYRSTKGADGYAWVKLKEMEETHSPEEYWYQFPENKPLKYSVAETVSQLEEVCKILEASNVFSCKVGWRESYNWLDVAWTVACDLLKSKPKVAAQMKRKNTSEPEDAVSLMFWSASLEYSAGKDGLLCLQHSIQPYNVDLVKHVMKSRFGERFTWNGSQEDAICIKLC